jgi:D-alanyl-D-alanine carboxypeptidase
MRHKNKNLFSLLVFSFFLLSFIPFSLANVQKSSIAICAETGEVFGESNADALTPPASLTKMMTLYMVFSALKRGELTLDQPIKISKHAAAQIPSKLWLRPGQTISVRDSIPALAVRSANDVAVGIAETLGNGSEKLFAKAMTQESRRLGMTNTVFRNASGVPHRPHNVTTARDMATLARALYKDFPEYFKHFKEKSFAYKGTTHHNHNKLLGKIPGIDGIKTGFINASGFNLAASVVQDNRRIIAIVMGGDSGPLRDRHMAKLIKATFADLRSQGEGQGTVYLAKETMRSDAGVQRAIYTPRRKGQRGQSLDQLFATLHQGKVHKASLKTSKSKKKIAKREKRCAKKKKKKRSQKA